MDAPRATIRRARRLRREMTLPEVLLWRELRLCPEGAPRFRRQHPLGPYVLDFHCPAAGLVVEVDGWGHNMGDQPARDERRDAWLAAQGLTVVRLPAAEVLADPDAAADGVVRHAAALARGRSGQRQAGAPSVTPSARQLPQEGST